MCRNWSSLPARRTDHDRPERRGADRPQRAGSQRGDSRLLAAGVLKQTTTGRRHRAFEAVALIDAFEVYAGAA
jgi:hypothetical protein